VKIRFNARQRKLEICVGHVPTYCTADHLTVIVSAENWHTAYASRKNSHRCLVCLL